MSQLNKLRKTLRDHYDSQQYSIAETEWERASALLQAARRKRRAGIIVLGVFTMGSLITLLLFAKPSAPTSLAMISALAETSLEMPPKQTENTSPSESAFSKNRSPEPTQKIIATSHSRIKAETISSPIKISEPSEETESVMIPQNPVENDDQALNAPFNPSETKNADPVEAKGPEPGETGINLMADILPGKPDNAETPGTNEPDLAETTEPESISEIEDTDKTTVNSYNEEKAIASIPEGENVYTISSETVQIVDAAVAEEVVKDSLSNPIKRQKQFSDGLFYEAGATWLAGWKNPAGRDASGFSPVIGLNYLNSLADKLYFSFGIQYLRVGNLSYSSKTSRETYYSYGENNKVTTIAPTTLHYLLAPFRLHYQLSERHLIGTNLNLAYLLNVDAKVTNYEERPGFRSEPASIRLSGYTDGFAWMDSQVGLFYTCRFRRNFGIQTEVFFGLKDVKQDEFFGLAGNERNSGLKITLIYYANGTK